MAAYYKFLCCETAVPGLYLLYANSSTHTEYLYVESLDGEFIGIDLYFPDLAAILQSRPPGLDEGFDRTIDVQSCGYYDVRTYTLADVAQENKENPEEDYVFALRAAIQRLKDREIFLEHQQEASTKLRLFVNKHSRILRLKPPTATKTEEDGYYVLRVAKHHEREVIPR